MKYWFLIVVLLPVSNLGQFFEHDVSEEMPSDGFFSESSENWSSPLLSETAPAYFSDSYDDWNTPPDYGEDAGGNPGMRVPIDHGMLLLIGAAGLIAGFALCRRSEFCPPSPGPSVNEAWK